MKTTRGICLHLLQLIILTLITQSVSAQLKAGFSASTTSGCPILVVSFKDISTGNPTGWKWDLGNGTISYEQNPVGSYFNPGTYHVKLVVSTAGEKDSVTQNDFIVVNSLPVPAFSASKTDGCFPLKVQFTDNSTPGSGAVNSWQWDFGDGTLSMEQNPSHTYTSPGSFTVILRVANDKGCSNVKTEPAFIKIRDGVKADFTSVTPPACNLPLPVSFTNTTQGTGTLNYRWEFGDGKTSILVNPTNNYAAGTYSVKLIATNSFGCSDTIIKSNAINIGVLHADFSGPDSVCVDETLTLVNQSTPLSATTSLWDFGDNSSSTQTDAKKIYSAAGQYNVTLVSSLATCKESIVKTITVVAKPTVAFTATNTNGCIGPLTVSFHDQSANGTSYRWDFGDGTTSNDQNPVHSYTTYGEYSVRLTVTNSLGCAITLVKDNLVKFAPLKIRAITGLGLSGCLPMTVGPTADIVNNIPIASYEWDFGDGAKSSSATPAHTYSTAGSYDVKLIVKTAAGCTDTFTLVEAVKVGNKPQALFSADPRDVCASTPVNFTDLSKNAPVDEWMWFFGDGTTSGLQNPTHLYNDTGYFTVTLTSSYLGCRDTLRLLDYVHILPPIASFDTSFLCNDPFKRDFIDRSLGATSWSWDFSDGATSTDRHPSHTFAGPGTYPVILTVSNGQCQHTTTRNVIVVKEHGTLSTNNTESCTNTRITLNVNGVTQNNISTFSWYVNGIPGYAAVTDNSALAWSFETTGSRLTAVVTTDILGCADTIYAAVPIKIFGPKASFGSNAPNTCFGNTINFTETSQSDGTHPIVEYLWSYGEGGPQSYAAGPFSHDYLQTGNYDVKLVVSDSYGCKDSITKQAFVSITRPLAKFTPSDTAICPSLPVTFNNASDGVNATYNWTFGDGATSTDVTPVHAYSAAGTYKVNLSMVDKNGCTSFDSTIINVYSAKADFDLSAAYSTCPPLTVGITNNSSNYISINWDFGDGGNSQLTNPSHMYTYPGRYTVNLTVRNNGGCFDVLTKEVVIAGPTGTFDYVPKEACNPGRLDYRITAQNAVKYIWDFDDGNTIYTLQPSTSHSYINPGTYLPKIGLEDQFGCQVPVKGLDTVKIHAIKTAIISDTKLLCNSGYVVFDDASTSDDVLSSFLWNFGDGTTSTLKNPTHHFADTGFYTIKLTTVTAFGCKDSSLSNNYIKVVNAPAIRMPGDTSACQPAKILLAGDLVTKDTSGITWDWNFGNGNTSNLQNPDSLTFVSSGSYQVSLKATNSDGCSDTVTRTVVIHPKPVVDAGADVAICRSDTYSLHATGADNYTWTSHPSLSCTNCATPAAKPDSIVTYHVTGQTLFGCSNEDSVTVNVHQPFKMVVNQGDTLCKGETFALRASGADAYQWYPSLWLNNASSATPIAQPDTSITYQVVGRDNIGCFKDTQSVKIKVYPIPTIDITNGDNVIVTVGGSIKLTTKNSPDVTTWRWFPSNWLSCATCSEPLSAPKDKITYSVTASNEGNCSATDQVTVNLICDNADVYMPNTFSPNADGANDVFYPRGKGLFNILTFKIFNRWGQLVFQKNGISANDPQSGWDGNLNGAPLQPDVYVYLLEVVCGNNTVFPFKGNVSLIH